MTSAHDVGTHAPTAPAPTGGPRPGRRSAAGALTGRAPADVGYLALAILVALAVAAVVALPFRAYRPPPAPTPSDLPAEVTVRDLDDSLTDAQEAELTRRIARIPSYRAWRIVVQLRDGEPLDARGRTTTWESVLRQERPDLYTEVNSTPELAPDLLVVDLDSSTNLDSIHSAAEFDEKDERNRRQLQDADDMLDTRMMSGDPVEAVPWALTWLLERMAEPVGTDRTTLTRTAGVIASTGAAVAVLPLARILHEYLVRRRAAWTRAREQYSRIVLGVEELRPTVELAAAQGGYGPAALTRWRVLARRSGELSRLVFDAGGLDSRAPHAGILPIGDVHDAVAEQPVLEGGSLGGDSCGSGRGRLHDAEERERTVARALLLAEDLDPAVASLRRVPLLLRDGGPPPADLLAEDLAPLTQGLEDCLALARDAGAQASPASVAAAAPCPDPGRRGAGAGRTPHRPGRPGARGRRGGRDGIGCCRPGGGLPGGFRPGDGRHGLAGRRPEDRRRRRRRLSRRRRGTAHRRAPGRGRTDPSAPGRALPLRERLGPGGRGRRPRGQRRVGPRSRPDR